ncbi:hypothetical protein [Breoghania sp.]|uniref:hypothetical protein n=1 Tax=Breoghania sp. TaxID=2065378 RepID=UPI002625B455|nr:hypothetical protein [Breoghania sp.]MDJ0933359.1 hypothetical protein [Breoghania sp.]
MTKRTPRKPAAELPAAAPALPNPPAAASAPVEEHPQWSNRLARSWSWLRGKMQFRQRNWLDFLATPFAGLTLFSLLLIVVLSYFIDDSVYRNLQVYYQTNMLRAVARTDVIADICRSQSDTLWKDCYAPDKRERPSQRFAWADAEFGQDNRPAEGIHTQTTGRSEEQRSGRLRGSRMASRAAAARGFRTASAGWSFCWRPPRSAPRGSRIRRTR